jgi:hypothetical protein
MGILLPNYMNVLHAATVLVPYYYPWLRCDIVYPPSSKMRQQQLLPIYVPQPQA